MHVSHSILLEVPLGSNKHIEDTERNLFDAERQRAFKPLPELHTPSSNTPFLLLQFICSRCKNTDGAKSYPNNCPAEIAQSRGCDRDHLRALAHLNTHAKQGGKLKAEKSRPSSWWVFHTCIVSYGITQDLWRGDGTSWWQNSADWLSPQSFPSWCPMSHKKEKDVKEARDKSEQSSQSLMKNASPYNHF